jgi:hypothetical protein
MTGFLMIIYSIAALVVAVEIGRFVHAREKAGRCACCAGTGRRHDGVRCLPCVGTGRAVPADPAADRHEGRAAV